MSGPVGYTTDNRDINETWLWLKDIRTTQEVRVLPWKLVEDVIENTDLDQDIKEKLVAELFGLRDRLDIMTR